MIKNLTAAVAAALVLSATTASPSFAGEPRHLAPPQAETSARGEIVSVRHVQHLSARQVRAALRKDSFRANWVRYGVEAYRLVCRTVDVGGQPTTASGLVVVPRNRTRHLRVVSYAHGTMAGRGEAPSVVSGGRSGEAMFFGAAGYATIAPDYLGLGLGPGTHPYLHLASEVSAQVDLLRAAQRLSKPLHRSFDRRILVTVFSQGGVAALGFAKALASGADHHFRLAAAAPISGPYALTTQELPAALDGRLDPTASAFYLTYVLTAYNRIYGLYANPSEVFAAPYDRTLAPLFDGDHDDQTIFAALPRTPEELLTPSWLVKLHHPDGQLLAALQANETACTGRSRPATVRLYAARGDEQVAVGNAYSCQQQLVDSGVRSRLIDTGDIGHNASGRRGLSRALGWFRHVAPPA